MPRPFRRPAAIPAAAAALLALAATLAPQPGRAHGIETSLQRLSGLSASLESRFSTGAPAADAAVRLVPPDGRQPIELGRTDAAGRLAFRLPGGVRDDWELQVDSGPGHRDYLELGEAGAAGTPAAAGQPEALRQLRREAAHPLQAWLLPLGGLALIGGTAAAGLRRRRR